MKCFEQIVWFSLIFTLTTMVSCENKKRDHEQKPLTKKSPKSINVTPKPNTSENSSIVQSKTLTAPKKSPFLPKVQPEKTPPSKTQLLLPTEKIKPLSLKIRNTILGKIKQGSIARKKIHYLDSVEFHHNLWFGSIKGLGGAYLGIGTDQNYTLSTVAGAKLVFLMDYDHEMLLLHKLYLLLIRNFKTPESIARFFLKINALKSLDFIKREGLKQYNPKEIDLLIKFYNRQREWMSVTHKVYYKKAFENKNPTWFTNQKIYNRWRQLVLANRVFVVLGDLRLGVAMRSIGDALREQKIPLRLIYLSNAEDYWQNYCSSFKKTMQELPFDEKSEIIRTTPLRMGNKYKLRDFYHYSIQKSLDFAKWMKYDGWLQIKYIVSKYYQPIKGDYFSRLPPPPPDLRKRREEEKKLEKKNRKQTK